MAERKGLLIRGLKLWFNFLLILGGVGVTLVLILGIGTIFEPADRADWTA